MSNATEQTIITGAENLAKSVVLPYLEGLAFSAVQAEIQSMIATDIARFPADQQPALVTQVVGDLKHWTRTKLGLFGFLVDIAWADGAFLSTLTTEVTTIAAATYAAGAPAAG